MNYSRTQKWLSSFLIFSLLFLQTFEVPMLSSTRAEAKMNADIVSFIVDDSLYGGAVKSKVLQYAKDIQAYLPNTRVVIFPVQKTANPFSIASINEKLFYEGDGEGLSRLIGTILIGEVPLPVVHKEQKAFMSVYPYVDFDNKSFVYDQTEKTYKYTTKTLSDEKPEIWHSVIRPNTGDESKNKNELVTFFNKTHDFYTQKGLFSPENTPQEPRVFYMDAFHDQESSSPDIWKSYNLYLENIEDISYRRFNKYLAKKLYDASQSFYGIESENVKDPAIKAILEAYSGSTMDISKAPDITTKDIIEKSVKQFFEVFNGKYMGDVLRYIHNTGRYGDANNVRADSAPVVIAKKDLFMRTALRDANTSLEWAIDALAKTKLAEPLKIATSHRINTITYAESTIAPDLTTIGTSPVASTVTPTINTKLYKNYFFGQEANAITDMKQCTIVRGSTLTVESNRGYNVKNAETDVNFLKSDLPNGQCFTSTAPATSSYWWGNSPLNFDTAKMQTGEVALKSHVYKGFVKPLYNIAGSRELESASPLHRATPEDCLANNMLLQPYVETDVDGIQTSWPRETNGSRFSCTTVHRPLSPYGDYAAYSKNLPTESCTLSKLELDGKIVKQSGSFCDEAVGTINYEKTYSFKTLTGNIMEHKSPTDEEYGIELKEMVTPSLPSDRDRYVDYLDKSMAYKKVVYPNFFRITLSGSELNYPSATGKIKELLDAKTAELQALGGDIDLYGILSADEKVLNAVIEGVIWNNMKNATLKYSSTLERSLGIDGEQKISADDKKNDYEIAYLGAPGDARNMYLKVDPEAKSPFPKEVSDILDQVNNYRGMIDGTNISSVESKAEFKCGPPEGVPIWEWLPAIFCWLGTILPPTISAGSCVGPDSSMDASKKSPSIFATPANALDANRNGVLDGYELIGNGELKIRNPEKVFGYGETVPLLAELQKDGKVIDIDSFNVVSFDIQKLRVVSSGKSVDSKVVYDREASGALSKIDNITPYINFQSAEIRAEKGLAKYGFSSKNEDIDVAFDVHILTKDRLGKTIVDTKSDTVNFSVRSEHISVQGKIKNGNLPFTPGSVMEAGNTNGILFNLKKVNKREIILSENLPYTLSVYDDIDNTLLRGPINVGKKEYRFNDASILQKTGVYRFEFIDQKGIKGFTTVTVLPAVPVKIETIPTSNTFIAGEKTTVLVRILDAFGNLAQGEVYKLNGSVSGGAGFIEDDKEPSSTLSKNIVEGYASFDVTNTRTSNAMNLSFRIDRANISSDPIVLRSIDFAKISVEVEDQKHIVVGKEKHAVHIKVLDANNQLLDTYNGILSLDFPKLSGTMSTPFVHISKGVSDSDIFLTPGYVAEKDVRIEAQIPGIKTMEGNIVTILPDEPMSFAFVKKDDRMEAREGNVNHTRATLYDRYGNIAYNTTGYNLSLRLREESKKYATLSKTKQTFMSGTVDFDIMATALPGKAYIIGTVTPGLEDHSFTLVDKTGKTLTVSGVSENVTLLDTYYLFNKSKLDALHYDAQYSVLLGGEYGDVTVSGYLGGEILFNHNSKSLAVTTLLNNPWKSEDLFGFTPAGKYTFVQKTDDMGSLQTTLSDNGKQSYISFYDAYRKEYIARAWLNIDPSTTSYLPCTSSGTDIANCDITPNTTVFMKGFDENIVTPENGWLSLYSANKIPLLRIDSSGKMEKYPGIEMELDDKTVSNLLGIRIVSNGAPMGYLGIKFSGDSIETVSSSGLPAALLSHKNGIVFESLSSRYSSRKTHLGVSSRGSEGVMFAMNDGASSEIGNLDRAYISASGPVGLEEYPKKTGIGWEDSNRMLLEVAAGTTIGNATKFYQTFSTITLGDAVSHLPQVSTANNFDRTVGTQISVGNGEQIESYKKIDVNGDGVPDIVIFYESGKIQLLINYSGSFKDMGYLAYVSDGGKWRKWVGNFFGDGYDDIVLTDTKWKLIILDNIEGKFVRISPVILNGSGIREDIHGYVQQMEVFDMDHDGKTDIVILDDSGEISILYGTERIIAGKREHIFTKKLIEGGLWLRLGEEVRNDGGVFSYNGLTFPGQGTNALGKPLDMDGMTGAVNQGMIDNIIYHQYSYQSNATGTGYSSKGADAAILGSVGTDDNGVPNAALAKEIADRLEETRLLAGSGNTDFSALYTSNRGSKRTFIRSPFAEGKGLKVEKSYRLMTSTSWSIMQVGDKIRVEITLTNTSSKAFRDAVYLDSNDRKIFHEEQEGIYTIVRDGENEEQHPLKYLTDGDFDYWFDFASIAPGEVIKIRYLVTANPIAFGKIGVGLLEKGESGDDLYGDISLSPNNMCGGELMMWRSVEPYARNYEKGTRKLVDRSKLPEELQKNAIDLDKNGIPDYIDELIESGKGDVSLLQKYSEMELSKYNTDKNKNSIPDRGDSKGSKVVAYNASNGSIEVGWLSSGNIEAINGQIDEVVRWLGCGFGGGSCLSLPMNWAPLAPGSTPSVMGYPLKSLSTGDGFPIFSALNSQMVWPYCIPMPWPPAKSIACTVDGAGGSLGDKSPTNFFRLYITPTITGAMGVAACFGVIPFVSGNTPMMGVSPLIPGGNCIVAAKPLSSCKDDGSDGDAGSLGLGIESNNPYVNANACIKQWAQWNNTALLPEDRRNLVSYVAGDNSHLPEISASMAQWRLSSLSAGPLIGIGQSGGGESNFEVSIDPASLKNFDFGNILKITNKRVSAFPDFLMDWANRQLEEVINKLTSLPTLYIILPDFTGFDITGYGKIFDRFSAWKAADPKDYSTSLRSSPSASNDTLKGAQGQYNSLVSNNAGAINSVGKNISGIKTAYEFMSKLPLIKLENEMVDIAVPWLSFEEMDKWLINAKLTMKQWKAELADKQDKWSRLANVSEADKKVIVQTESLIGTLQENINIIEEYKRFPEKLQKYLTWKERYASQLLCNIEAIEFMMGGWISDNGQRFRTWVELYILIKAILKSWQMIVDLFYGYEKECAVCRNERYDLKHFIFKLISAIIPKIPIIQFPKWPDIWLDLHNIRGGLRILMPEFHFNFVPMILPELPRLLLPDVPTVGIGLPGLPILPRLPELPELPDLPSLPNIKLPDLPPPPTIPKLFGGIAAVLEIFKIVAKIKCIMNINPFVPEWRAGDQIAQLTERQGVMPGLDFLNIEFPNFPLSFIDAIKVGSFVNLESDIDFITAMAKATLDPVNTFTNDLSNIGSIVVPNVNLKDVVPGHVEVTVKPEAYMKEKKIDKNEMMTLLLRKLSFDVLHNFVALNQYMEKHSKEEVTVQGLRDILTENIGTIRAMHDPKALAIADVLQKAVTYSGDSETKFIQDLTNQNTEKFRLVKDYIKGEKMEATRLKTEMDTLLRTGTMDGETLPSFLPIGGENIKAWALSTDTWFSDEIQQKILAINARIFPSLERIKNGDKDTEALSIQEKGNSLLTEVESNLASFARDAKRNETNHTLAYTNSTNKLLSIVTPSESVVSESALSSTQGASPTSSYQYEGIYILDKNNKQVRLFDYTDGVDGTEELVYSDVDQDGDDDIIYRMDNSLYLKQNFQEDVVAGHYSDVPKVYNWQDFLQMVSENGVSKILSAPNHFEETFIASNEIDFSFRPANPLKDNFFRLEYYDYVDRFDKVHSEEDPLSLSPKTPIHKVDLIPELLSETVSDTTHTGFIGRNTVLSFGRGSGEASVTLNAYQFVTPETNGRSNPIIIAAWRTVYTDAGGATISYIRDGEKDPQTLSFDRNMNYEFLTNTKIWVLSGKLYLFKTSLEQKKLNAGDLYGMPVLPETKIELLGESSFLSFSYYDRSSMRLDGPGTYQYFPLGKKGEEYNVSIGASNDWYYAQLYSFEKKIQSTVASLHLLSPQKQADTEGPLITYGDAIRVPVYQKQTLSLATYLEDISGIDSIWVDADLRADTDGNGNVADDIDSLDPRASYGIKKGNTLYNLEIGPFDTLFTKKVRLFAQDWNGNISSKDLILTVYPPVPAIQSLSGSHVSGDMNEVLGGEPIDIFRLRNGTLARIEPTQSGSIQTAENGVFTLIAKDTSGIILTQSGKTIARVDERTGKIVLDDTSFRIIAVPADAGSPLRIQVQDASKKTLFSENINVSAISHIEQASSIDSVTGTGIFVSPSDGFSFAKNTISSPNLPGGGYITDTDHKAIAGVSKWGDIYLLSTKYSLLYATKGAYILIKIQDADHNTVASVLYRIDAEYVIK